MDKKDLYSFFIQILSSELTGSKQNVADNSFFVADFLSVYNISKKQDLAHIVSSYLRNNKAEVQAVVVQKFYSEEINSVVWYGKQKYALENICDTFNKAKVAYIPLKGSIIRPYYTVPSMRTSCDIDILIHESDIDIAVDALKKSGYTGEQRNYHDISLFSPEGVHLELHFSLFEANVKLDAVLANAWNYATNCEEFKYKFSDEFFVFHMFAHMSHHFSNGGCGIRNLMDIWVMRHKMGVDFNIAKPLLENAGIYKFAEKMAKLAENCFNGNNLSEFEWQIIFYILEGGIYGSTKNRVAIKSDEKGKFKFLLNRLFMPYDILKSIYPIIEKHKWLTPFAQVARWVRRLSAGRFNSVKNELKYTVSVTDSESERLRKMLDDLGL